MTEAAISTLKNHLPDSGLCWLVAGLRRDLVDKTFWLVSP
jgi:hypothetical protein